MAFYLVFTIYLLYFPLVRFFEVHIEHIARSITRRRIESVEIELLVLTAIIQACGRDLIGEAFIIFNVVLETLNAYHDSACIYAGLISAEIKWCFAWADDSFSCSSRFTTTKLSLILSLKPTRESVRSKR